MPIDSLIFQIRQQFGFQPTADQERAIHEFAAFVADSSPSALMILRGSAGTGKTSLASAIVQTLVKCGQKVVLLAPTGRAAKVFELNSGHSAFTIHRKIYRQRSLMGDFNLNDNLHSNTLFLVDEASMIANSSLPLPPSRRGGTASPTGESLEGAFFGSGNLLDDLVSYVYNGRDCRLMLIGDHAQLPPVGMEESPALDANWMRGYGLIVHEADLNEVLRQSQESGILMNANEIRQMITHDEMTQLPQIRFQGFADLRIVTGDELIESISSSYSHVGIDETMIVTRSNKRANAYNMGIRNTILGREDMLCMGDQLLVVKNNYYWLTQNNPPSPDNQLSPPLRGEVGKGLSNLSFIANGDCARVQRVRHVRQLYGFTFADVSLQFPDYENLELHATVVLDTLTAEAPALTREQSDLLYNNVMEDYADIPLKTDRLKRLREDPHFNALQIKYAYAVTCHKAQGGQWSHVYIDQGYMTDDMLTPDYIHWLYTAFTRATETLFLVNWPNKMMKEEG
ncbi:MAG: AAA family ATPase [Prevotella sp.]|nr:AAA family ATPase [Prevotella sp.]